MDIRNELNKQDVDMIIRAHHLPAELSSEKYRMIDKFSYVNEFHSLVEYEIVYMDDDQVQLQVASRYKLSDGQLSPLYNQVNFRDNLIMVCRHDEAVDDIFFVHARMGDRIERFNICSDEWIRPLFTWEQIQEVKKQGGFSPLTQEISKNNCLTKQRVKK